MIESKEIQQKTFEDANATEGSRSPTPSVHEAASVPSKRNKDISTSVLKKKKVQEGQSNEDGDIQEDPREKMSSKFDILSWWKVNSTRFPILAHIARDVLAIPMSTVASELAFSTWGRVLDQYRSSLSPRTVEALICTQNWFRSTPLSFDMEEQADNIDKAEIDKAGPLADSGSNLDL